MCSGDHKSGLEALDAEAAAALDALKAAIAPPTTPAAFVAPAFSPETPAVSLGMLLGGYVTAVQRQLTARDAIIDDLLDLIVKKDAELYDHRRHRFGRKSEKDTGTKAPSETEANDEATGCIAELEPGEGEPETLEDVDDADETNAASAEPKSAGPDYTDNTPKNKPKGSRKSPAKHEKEPDEVILHEPDCRTCAICGARMRIKGYDDTVRKTLVEAHIKLIMERYAILSCDGCERVEQVPRAPNLFAGSSYDVSVMAGIAMQKFAASTSLYTLDKVIFSGFDGLTRSWMSRLLGDLAESLVDLWEAQAEHILSSPSIHLDETHLPVLGVVKGEAHHGYGFAIMTGGLGSADSKQPTIFFKYSDNRKGAFAESMLEGFEGACTVDKFPGYLRFCSLKMQKGMRVRIMFCHAHARRNFKKLADSQKSPVARHMVNLYKSLYAIEGKIRGASAERRSEVRRHEALPILREMRRYLLSQRERVPKTGSLADAIGYILDNFREFRRYCLIGSAEIDNNPLERGIRRWTVTRRSSLFAGSPKGARTWSILSSVIETCKLHHVDPFRFLTWYCRKKAELGDSFEPRQHFPWDFKAHPDYATFNPSELPRSTTLRSQRQASASPRAAA